MDTSSSVKKLRYGILCSGTVFQQWQANAIRQLMEEGVVPVLLVADANPGPKPGLLEKLRHYPYSKLLVRLYQRYCFRPASKKPVSLEEELSGVPVLNCQTTRKGYSEYFQQDDIEAIKAAKPDFLLRFGFGILRGEILKAARYGVWSFHHDDEQKYRGVPTGFWEIYRNDPVNAAILQRLTDKLDGGIILRKGWFGTIHHSWSANLDQLYFETSGWVVQVCRDIRNGRAEYLHQAESATAAKMHKLPGNLVMLHFLIKILRNKLAFHWKDLFRAEIWSVGMFRGNPGEVVAAGIPAEKQVHWLPEPGRGAYYADPFAFAEGPTLNLVCEHYRYRSRSATLAMLELKEGGEARLLADPAIQRDTHLSFPCILHHEGKVWCIPENYQHNRLDLFLYDTDTKTFGYFKTLLDGVDAVDPVLFYHDELWWLMFTRHHQSCTHLYIWYSCNFFGPFKPHANNPVKTDIRSTRPAGLPFYFQEQLLRPVQDCAETYGGRVVLNRVTRLSPYEFAEEPFSTVEPPPASRYRKGLHTLSFAGGYVIIDGKRYAFVWDHFRAKLGEKCRLSPSSPPLSP